MIPVPQKEGVGEKPSHAILNIEYNLLEILTKRAFLNKQIKNKGTVHT
jgi:hypothetical protein